MDRQLKEISLYGLEKEYIDSKDLYNQITNLWKRVNKLKSENSVKLPYPWLKYGVIYRKDNIYYYFAGFKVAPNDKVEGLINYKMNVENSIKYEYQGNMFGLKQYYKSLFKELKKNDVAYCQNPLLIELYTPKFKWNAKGSIIEVIIPIRKDK